MQTKFSKSHHFAFRKEFTAVQQSGFCQYQRAGKVVKNFVGFFAICLMNDLCEPFNQCVAGRSSQIEFSTRWRVCQCRVSKIWSSKVEYDLTRPGFQIDILSACQKQKCHKARMGFHSIRNIWYFPVSTETCSHLTNSFKWPGFGFFRRAAKMALAKFESCATNYFRSCTAKYHGILG